MSFDWMKFWHLSDELVKSGSQPVLDEAKLRSAVSRAYYAAYNVAFSYLKSHAQHPIGSDKHKATYERFKKFTDSRRKSIGNSLERLRNSRVIADYDDIPPPRSNVDFTQVKTVEKCLLESKDTIEQILALKRGQY